MTTANPWRDIVEQGVARPLPPTPAPVNPWQDIVEKVDEPEPEVNVADMIPTDLDWTGVAFEPETPLEVPIVAPAIEGVMSRRQEGFPPEAPAQEPDRSPFGQDLAFEAAPEDKGGILGYPERERAKPVGWDKYTVLDKADWYLTPLKQVLYRTGGQMVKQMPGISRLIEPEILQESMQQDMVEDPSWYQKSPEAVGFVTELWLEYQAMAAVWGLTGLGRALNAGGKLIAKPFIGKQLIKHGGMPALKNMPKGKAAYLGRRALQQFLEAAPENAGFLGSWMGLKELAQEGATPKSIAAEAYKGAKVGVAFAAAKPLVKPAVQAIGRKLRKTPPPPPKPPMTQPEIQAAEIARAKEYQAIHGEFPAWARQKYAGAGLGQQPAAPIPAAKPAPTAAPAQPPAVRPAAQLAAAPTAAPIVPAPVVAPPKQKFGIAPTENGGWKVIDWNTQQEVGAIAYSDKNMAIARAADLNQHPPKPRKAPKPRWAKEDAVLITPQELTDYAMKHEAKGSAAGFRAGQLDVRATHIELTQFAKEHLPREEQYKVMNAIAKARTPAEVRRAGEAVNKILVNYERRLLIGEVKALKKDVAKTKLLQPYQQKIDAILDEIATVTHTRKLLQRMESLRDHLLRKEIAGEEHDVPITLIDRMREILADPHKKQLREMDPKEIRGVLSAIRNLLHTHKTRTKIQVGREQRDFVAARDEVIGDMQTRHGTRYAAKPGEYAPLETQGPLAQLATWKQLSQDRKAAIVFGRDTTGWQILSGNLFEGMRNGAAYDNWVSDETAAAIVRVVPDSQKWLRSVSAPATAKPGKPRKHEAIIHTVALPSATTRAGERVTSLQLTAGEKMEIHNMWQDLWVREQLSKHKGPGIRFSRRMGRTIFLEPDDIRAIITTMSAQEVEIANTLLALHNGEAQLRFDQAWLADKGYSITEPDKIHWPVKRDTEYLEQDPDVVMAQFHATRLDQQGIMKDRKGGSKPLVVQDIFAHWMSYNRKVGAYIGKSQAANNAVRLLNDKKFMESVRESFKYGDDLLKDMLAAVTEYRGLEVRPADAAFEKWTRSLLRRIHIATLGFKPHIPLFQTVSAITSLADPAMEAKHLFNPSNWRRFNDPGVMEQIHRFSPLLWQRINHGSGSQIISASASVGPSLEQYTIGKQSMWQRITGLPAIRLGDQSVVVLVWRAHMARLKDVGLIGEALMEETAKATERTFWLTQPTYDPLSTAAFAREARKGMVMKLASMYSSQRSKNTQIVLEAISDYNHSPKKIADKSRLLKYLTLGLWANTLMIYGIRQGVHRVLRGQDDRDWIDHSLGILTQLLSTFPIFGPLMATATAALAAGARRSQAWNPNNPLGQITEDATKFMWYTGKLIDDLVNDRRYHGEEMWPRDLTRAAMRVARLAGMLGGIPIGGWKLWADRWFQKLPGQKRPVKEEPIRMSERLP